MARSPLAEKIFVWSIKIGLCILPFIPLYVSGTLLFPFITGKNFAFRIMTEILFALWVALAISFKEYRPRFTPLFKAVSIFIGVLFLADLFSPNSYRAFFANYERMEGFLMLLHLYLYFIMMGSLFRTRRDWLIFFHVTVAASTLVAGVGWLQRYCANPLNAQFCASLAQRFSQNSILSAIPLVSRQGGYRVDSTIGNPAYLAAYLVFHLWILLLLMRWFWRRWLLVGLYTIVFLFELYITYLTATRGAAVGLVGSSFLFTLALVIWWRRALGSPSLQGAHGHAGNHYQKPREHSFSWGRLIATAALAMTVVAPIGIYVFRHQSFIANNQVLNRFASISLSDRTVQSRFAIWKMSLAGALDRPILGWGQENYYLVFQKYYQPALFAQEPWFDRSHNVFLDWLVHAGFGGLVAYLSMLGIALWTVLRSLRARVMTYWEGFVVLGAFAAYFIQNLFVFDNLNTYFLFFSVLAYVHCRTPLPEAEEAVPAKNTGREKNHKHRPAVVPSQAGLWGGAGAGLFVVFLLIVFLHYPAMAKSETLIRALNLYQSNAPLEQVEETFVRALAYGGLGDTEVREQFSNIARSVLDAPNRGSDQVRAQFVTRAIEELQKETSTPAKDVKHMLFMATLMDRALELNQNYPAEAERILKEALLLSPSKQIIYFELAQHYLLRNNLPATLDTLRKAWELDKSYREAGANYLTIALFTGNTALAESVRKELDIYLLPEAALYRVALAYDRVRHFADALPILAWLVEKSPTSGEYQAQYARLLALVGRMEEAKIPARRAVALDKRYAGEQVIIQILGGELKPTPTSSRSTP